MSCISTQHTRIGRMSLSQNRTEVKGHIIAEAPCSVLQPELNFSIVPKMCTLAKNGTAKRFNSVHLEYNEDDVYVTNYDLTVYLSKLKDKGGKDVKYHITVLKNRVGQGQNQLFLTVPLTQPSEGKLVYTIQTRNNIRYHEIYIYHDDSREKRIVIKLDDCYRGNLFTQKVIPVVHRLCENHIITHFNTEATTSFKEYNEVSPAKIVTLLTHPTPCTKDKKMATKTESSSSSVSIDNKPYNLKPLTLQQVKEICEILKTAIFSGNIDQSKQIAARLASERIKVEIEVDENSLGRSVNDVFSLSVYVEDRESGSTRPILLKVTAMDTIKDLKLKFLMLYTFPFEVQKWIIDKKLPLDSDTLYQHRIRGSGHTAYVYLMSAKSVNLTSEKYNQQLATGTQMPTPGKSLTIPRNQLAPSGEYVPMNSPVRSKSFIPKTDVSHNEYVNMSGEPDIMSSQLSLHTYESVESVKNLHHVGPPVRNSCGPLRNSGQSNNHPPILPKPLRTIKSQEVIKPIGWTCLQCTYINIPTRPGCEICSADRPTDYTVPTQYVLPDEEIDRIRREEEIERQIQQDLTENVDTNTQQGLSERELDLILQFNDAIQSHEDKQESFVMEDCYDVIPPSPIITKSEGDRNS